jgi:hypothetical protein
MPDRCFWPANGITAVEERLQEREFIKVSNHKYDGSMNIELKEV